MSDNINIAIIAEGKTDFIMLEAVIKSIIQNYDPKITLIQPEESNINHLGGGWRGVCLWCDELKNTNSNIVDDIIFINYDLIIIQLDADVADVNYSSYPYLHINYNDLPCRKGCPPVSDTTDELRKVLLNWLGMKSVPPKTILCTPSKSLESWVLCGLYPKDIFVKNKSIECRDNPEQLLESKPLPRLISNGKKNVDEYKRRSVEFGRSWSFITTVCTEAKRFEDELKSTLAAGN
jgi:hypothetical protein